MASGAGHLRQALSSQWIIAVAAALACGLTLPSLENGLSIDDHMLRARVVTDRWTAAHSAADLFGYADPDRPAETADAMARGELSWWAAPQLRWRFMRPLPALLHHAEFAASGRGGVGWMHLHSVLWMAALAAAAAALYRRLLGATWLAGFAALLFAIDDGHGFVVGWLANRCALIGAVAAVFSLIAHDRWRRDRRRWGGVLGPLGFAVALACSEQMLGALGFFVAYAIVLDATSWRRRAAALAPYLAVAIAWSVTRALLGYGTAGTGSYTDPFDQPLAFLGQAAQRIPILIHSLLGALPADLWEVYFVRHGLTWLMVMLGVGFVVIIGLGFARLLRADRLARFWALGGGLALIAACGAHPTDRQLLLVSLAGSALVARFLAAWLSRSAAGERALLPRRGASALAIALFAIHAVIAPVLLPVRARLPGAVSRGVGRIDALVPSDAALADQDLVLVAVPFKYLCNFASVVRRSNGGVSPKRWRCLGVAPDGATITRPDERTLVVRPEHGYLRYFEDTNVRAHRIPFAIGDRVALPDFTITILAITGDGRPAAVEFRFAVPLEDHALRWLIWRAGAYQPFTPPPVGATIAIAAEPFAFGDLLQR